MEPNHEQNGLPSGAVRQALAAEDFVRAAGLVELAWPAIHRSFQYATFIGWVKALPDERVRARPVLSAGYGWALLIRGELEAGEAPLRDGERWLDTTADMSEPPEAPSPEATRWTGAAPSPTRAPIGGNGSRPKRVQERTSSTDDPRNGLLNAIDIRPEPKWRIS